MATRVGLFFKLYWRALVIILLPIVAMPIFLVEEKNKGLRCLYVVVVMAGYWVTEAISVTATAFIPMVLFPAMSILDSKETCAGYVNDTVMMFMGGLIIAIALEYSGLCVRMSLVVMKIIGCSHLKLSAGLMTVTTFISMWISNTAATAIMCPIMEATLKEFEAQGLLEYWTAESKEGRDEENPDDKELFRPTRITRCYFLIAAYASSIGGLGTMIGTGTNLTFQGIYVTRFPKAEDFTFLMWMAFGIPVMIITAMLTWLFLIIWFFGFLRPKSTDAQNARLTPEQLQIAKGIVKQKLTDLGPMSFQEIVVFALFLLGIFLWIFRDPKFVEGWAAYLTPYKMLDSSVAFFIVLAFFMIPAKPTFIYVCAKDEAKRPTAASKPLVTWNYVEKNLPWGVCFLLGAGFVIAKAATITGMSKMIAERLDFLKVLHVILATFLLVTFASFITEFTSNVAVANVILPIAAEVSVSSKWHPAHLMLPTCMACSESFCLPVGTPPNAIIRGYCNIPTVQMIVPGFFVSLIGIGVITAVVPPIGYVIMSMNETPDWAV